MKKLIIVPACILLLSGAMPRNVEVQNFHRTYHAEIPSVTTKIDSINTKGIELTELLKQLK